MSLTWTRQLSVGNAVIDSDHKNLMAIVGGVERAVRAKDHWGIPQAFELLEGWLCAHFANEEKIALATGLDFLRHRQAQQYSLAELRCLRDGIVARNGIWSGNATKHDIQSLRVWMVGHIDADMPLKPLLQNLDYGFWPGGRKGEINRAAGHTASLYLHLFDTPTPCAA